MRKKIYLLFIIAASLCAATYTIHANTHRKVTVIEIPEGQITVEVTEGVGNYPGNADQNSGANVEIEFETIQVPEGIITVRKEEVIGGTQSEQISENPWTAPGRLLIETECSQKIEIIEGYIRFDQASENPSVNGQPEDRLQHAIFIPCHLIGDSKD